jgi:ATP-dependent Clp protease ATP-binding subunit ClpC
MLMLPSEKYTPRSQQALNLAWSEAQTLGGACIGSQHLLLGLLILGNGVQFHILTKYGFTVDSERESIRQGNPESEHHKKIDGIPFGVSAQAALKRARQEAIAMNHSYLGTEHILLSLLTEEKGGAATLFAAQKIDAAKVRQEILMECGRF